MMPKAGETKRLAARRLASAQHQVQTHARWRDVAGVSVACWPKRMPGRQSWCKCRPSGFGPLRPLSVAGALAARFTEDIYIKSLCLKKKKERLKKKVGAWRVSFRGVLS
jgi:hypothetical protein